MDPPGIRYVGRDGQALAYQVVGNAPLDVVWSLEISQHLDIMWTDPHIHYLFERGSTFARSAYFQRRGIGLSDPLDHVPTLEAQADDVLAVMDAIGMAKATLVGVGSTCGPLALLAARSPERVDGLVFIQPFAERILDNDAAYGWGTAERERFIRQWREIGERWGTGMSLSGWDPDADSPYNRRLMAVLERCSATPAAARAHLEWIFRLDYSAALPSIQCPVRVLLGPSSLVPESVARHVADLIPHGTFELLPTPPAGASLGEAWRPIVDHVEEVATGIRHPSDADRFLASVLFTDVVGSTEILARIGDVAYQGLRAEHERQVRDAVECAGGRLVNVSGDGTFSVFDGPVAAVQAARVILDKATALGLTVRAGVHSGDVDRTGPELAGLTIHIGARICAAAGPGDVLVSQTVRDLVVGSGLSFTPHGVHQLKGVPGRWSLYALGDTDHTHYAIPGMRPALTTIDRAILRTARRAPQLLRGAREFASARRRRQSS